ncbi:MAG: class I tRNA ligase family protein, partial [Candidatus Nanoarchaeia archaeon]
SKFYESYECSRARTEIENFFWHVFADNYIEIVKKRIYNETGNKKSSAQYVLYQGLWAILRMVAPITPFITEEIYQNNFKKHEKQKSIHLCAWPEKIDVKGKKNDEEKWNKLIKIITKIRQEKSNAKKSVNAEINLTLNADDLSVVKDVEEDFKTVMSVKELNKGKFKVEFV